MCFTGDFFLPVRKHNNAGDTKEKSETNVAAPCVPPDQTLFDLINTRNAEVSRYNEMIEKLNGELKADRQAIDKASPDNPELKSMIDAYNNKLLWLKQTLEKTKLQLQTIKQWQRNIKRR